VDIPHPVLGRRDDRHFPVTDRPQIGGFPRSAAGARFAMLDADDPQSSPGKGNMRKHFQWLRAGLLAVAVGVAGAVVAPAAAAQADVVYLPYVLAGTNFCLTATGTAQGSAVWVEGCNGSTSQNWGLNTSNGSLGTLVPQNATSMCLDIPYGNFVSGASLWIQPCNGGVAQVFKFGPTPSGAIGADNTILAAYTSPPLCMSAANYPSDFTVYLQDCGVGTTKMGWDNAFNQNPYGAPHAFGLTYHPESGAVVLEDESLYDSGYNWYLDIYGGSSTLVHTTPALAGIYRGDSINVLNLGLQLGQTFNIRVVASNAYGTATHTLGIDAKVPTVYPTNVALQGVSADGASVSWTPDTSIYSGEQEVLGYQMIDASTGLGVQYDTYTNPPPSTMYGYIPGYYAYGGCFLVSAYNLWGAGPAMQVCSYDPIVDQQGP
jgi:hypothetical protein